MPSLRACLDRIAGLIARERRDRDFSAELDAHVQAHIEDNVRAGMTPAEARRQAVVALGGISPTTESQRDRGGLPFVETTVQDVRYALRLLWKSPGYAIAAVAALAIGIGANTAVFSIVDGVLIKAFPYKDPQQLVLLYEQLPNAPFKFGFSPPDFQTVNELGRSYSGLAAYFTRSLEISGRVAPQRVNSARVSPSLFALLGVAPAAGRALTEDDDRQNARVAVISHALWTRAFGRDPALVGKTVALDGQSYSIVGIMPEPFVFPPRGGGLGLGGERFNSEPADVFVPMSFLPFERQAFGMLYNNSVVARLKPGVSNEQARAELSSLVAPVLDRYPPPIRSFVAHLTMPISPMFDETVGNSRRLIVVLMAAVGLVLLIGCADVASLILTRSAARQRELAIRAALGATGARIVRQLLTEAFVLAAAGCAVGLMLAYALMRGLLLLAGELPRSESIAYDTSMALFALALAIVTPLVFGVVPAFRTARGMDSEALKESGRSLTSGRRKAWLLGSLVVGQVALALVLSVGAGLLVRSFARLLQSDAGFRAEHSVRATVTLPIGRYAPPTVKPFYLQAIDVLRAAPGVSAVGAGDLPLAVRERRAFTADASARPIPESSRLIATAWTSGAYFDALGIPLTRGRVLTEADGPTGQRVAVVNERLARLAWPGTDPVGHQIKWGIEASQSPWMTIVGVVADVKQAGLDTPAIAQVYVPLAQDDTGGDFRTVNLIIRSARDSVSVAHDTRGIVQRLDPSLPVTVQTLDEMVGESAQPQRFSMTVMTAFAGLALLLAALGIYGVLANAVAQQTQDIGVRIALGATAFDIMWMVLIRALTLTGIGLAIGIVGALAITRTMAGLLFEVRPTDIVSFAGAIASLAAVALLASLVPAWRATRVDPIVALRSE